MFNCVCLILIVHSVLICVAASRDKVKPLGTTEYPQIKLYIDGYLQISPNKTTGGIKEYRFKNEDQIEELVLGCTHSSPVEWSFECPEIISPQISITKQVVWRDQIRWNSEYHTNLTLRKDLSQTGYAQNPDFGGNVTCLMVENPTKNSSVIFRNHLQTNVDFIVQTRNNFVFNRTKNCPLIDQIYQSDGPIAMPLRTSNHSCPLKISVDLHTATFSCDSRNQSGAIIQVKKEPCYDKMDYCKSLAIASATCVNFTKGSKFNQHFPSPINTFGIVKCVDPNENWVAALFYIVLGESINQRVLNKAEDVLRLPEALVLKPESRVQFYVENQFAVFICEAYTSVFAMGLVISYVHKNMSNILLESPGNETIRNHDIFSIYVKTVNVTINKNMTQIICEAPVAYSREWKLKQLNITVRDGEKPKLVKSEITFSNDSMNVYQCDATGIPPPTITWFKMTMTEIKRQTRIDSSFMTRRHKTINSTLIVEKSFVANSTIVCKASNVVGEAVFDFDAKTSEEGVWRIVYVLLVVIVIVLLTVSIIGVLFYKRWKLRGAILLTDEDCEEFYKGNKFLNHSDPLSGALLLAYDINFEVPRSEITMGPTVLGSGQFGIVIQGCYQGTTVAVKTIRHTTDIKYFKALLAELKILQYLGHHPNIVNLVGACTTNIRKMEVLLLLDYCENGNLVKFLRSCRSTFLDLYHHADDDITRVPVYENNIVRFITTKELVRFSLQVAEACVFIGDKKILHGDLACRNILVSGDRNVKICDFGLAKQLLQYSLYIQKDECPLPLRWMSLESLQDMEFSIQSDVWSTGVVLWEIFSLAEMPYPGMDWSFESWRMLKDGYRMDKPSYSNKSIYQLMLKCWKNDPQDRPTFKFLAKSLRDELDALRENG